MAFLRPKLCMFMAERMHFCALDHVICVAETMHFYCLNDAFVCLNHGIFVAETMHVYGRNDAFLWSKPWHFYSRIYAFL